MKLKNCRLIGTYTRPNESNVNVHKGTVVGRGTDCYYWLLQGKRQIISETEFWSTWRKVK